MNKRMMGIAAAGIVLSGGAAAAQSLGWSYARQSQSANISEQGGGPGGRLEACSEEIGKCIGREPGGRACLEANKERLSAACKAVLAAPPPGRGGEEIRIPPCVHSVACASTLGGTKVTLRHRAIGLLEETHRQNISKGWQHYLDNVSQDFV